MERESEAFIERVGVNFERDGLARTSGRLLGLLLLREDPLSLDELAETLQASKASVSTNARFLERMGALERVGQPGDRRDYYRIAHLMHAQMLELRLDQLRRTRDALRLGLETPESRGSEQVRGRLESLRCFYDAMVDVIADARDQWATRQDPAAALDGNDEENT